MSASRAGRPTRLRAAGIVASLVSLAAVAWWAVHQPAPELPSGSHELAALLAAIGIYGLATGVRAERWRLLLHRGGADAVRADCYALTAVGYMGNNVLPARAGDVLRVYLLAPRARTGRREVIGTLVAERALDVVTLLGLFVVLAYGVLHGEDKPSAGRLGLVAGVLAAAALAAVAAYVVARRSERGRRLLEFVAPMLRSLRELRGRYGAALLGVTLGLWLLEAGSWYFSAVAANVDISPLESLYILSLASIFVLIPSGPGYLGTLDAAIVFGARAFGASGGEALSYVLTLRFVLFAPITLAGAIAFVARYGGWSRARLEGLGDSAPAARET